MNWRGGLSDSWETGRNDLAARKEGIVTRGLRSMLAAQSGRRRFHPSFLTMGKCGDMSCAVALD